MTTPEPTAKSAEESNGDNNDLADKIAKMNIERHMSVGPGGTEYRGAGGLSRRELFASMAMEALIANPDPCFVEGPCAKYVAKGAVAMADALIAELSKEPKPNA